MMLKLVLSTLLLLQLWQGQVVADPVCTPSDQFKAIENRFTRIQNQLAESDGDRAKLDQLLDDLRASSEKTNAKVVQVVTQELTNKLEKLADQVEELDSRVGSCCQGGAVVTPGVTPVEPAREGYFDIFGTGKQEWRLAFRGTPDVGVGAYQAFLDGTGIAVKVDPGCKQFSNDVPCNTHYRNEEVFDNWNNIDEVLFAIYDDGEVVQWVRFNGKLSDKINWFMDVKIIASSWTDLRTLPHNIFSLYGEPLAWSQRRFFMSNMYGGCPNDKSWFFSAESVDGATPQRGCPYERTTSIPKFHYAPGNTVVLMSGDEPRFADAIGVFVKYEDQ